MNDTEQAFHASVKPSWTTDGTMVYGIPAKSPNLQQGMAKIKQSLVSEGKDIRFAKFVSAEDVRTKPSK